MLSTRSKLDLLLNGSMHLNYASNVALFTAVQTYIYKFIYKYIYKMFLIDTSFGICCLYSYICALVNVILCLNLSAYVY